MFFSVFAVALLAEGVDRNLLIAILRRLLRGVALLAEGVDRNSNPCVPAQEQPKVALLAEGVDRNQIVLIRLKDNL